MYRFSIYWALMTFQSLLDYMCRLLLLLPSYLHPVTFWTEKNAHFSLKTPVPKNLLQSDRNYTANARIVLPNAALTLRPIFSMRNIKCKKGIVVWYIVLNASSHAALPTNPSFLECRVKEEEEEEEGEKERLRCRSLYCPMLFPTTILQVHSVLRRTIACARV